jgi:hypothetical protein
MGGELHLPASVHEAPPTSYAQQRQAVTLAPLERIPVVFEAKRRGGGRQSGAGHSVPRVCEPNINEQKRRRISVTASVLIMKYPCASRECWARTKPIGR